MPRLPSIFENEDFIKELSGLFNKTAQAAPAQQQWWDAANQDASTSNAQLALDMVNNFPSDRLTAGSSVSLAGSVKPENQPGVSDLYSLDAFIRYLGAESTGGDAGPIPGAGTPKNNFQYNVQGGGQLPLVVPGGGQEQKIPAGYVLYNSQVGPFLVHKEGLIDVLKTMANSAAATDNLYLKELIHKLIDEVTSLKELDIKPDTFKENKAKLDPSAQTPAAPAVPGAAQPAPGQVGSPSMNAVQISDKSQGQGVAQGPGQQATGDASLSDIGIPSLYNWLPFWGNGRVNFTDIDYFVSLFNKAALEHAAQIGLDFRLINNIAPFEQEIRNLESQFDAATANAPLLRSSRGIQYAIDSSPIEAVHDFKGQFGTPGSVQQSYSLQNQISVAQIMQRTVQITRYLLQMLLSTAFATRIPDFKEMIQQQIDEANKLQLDLGQAVQLIENQVQAIKPAGR